MDTLDTGSFKIEQVVQIDPDRIGFDRDWSLRQKFGEVVAIDPERGTHCIQVNLGINFRRDIYERLTGGKGWFMTSELEIQEAGWTPITRADFLFVLSVNAVAPLGFPWTPENRCMHEDHDEGDAPQAVRRAMVNVFGTVQEIDVCEAHLGQDGRCADDIPYRKSTASFTDVIIHPKLERLSHMLG